MNIRKGFTLIEILIVIVIMGILSAIAIPAFNKNAERAKAKADSVAVIDSVAWENSYRRDLAMQDGKRLVARMRTAFAGPSMSFGRKPEDKICDTYMSLIEMQLAFDEDDSVFVRAGIDRPKARQMYIDSARFFTDKIGKIIVMSDDARKKLQSGWEHTCDGMLKPTDQEQLIYVYTRVLVDSKATKPVLGTALRSVLLEHYRAGSAKVIENDGRLGEDYEGFFWFKKEELLSKK